MRRPTLAVIISAVLLHSTAARAQYEPHSPAFEVPDEQPDNSPIAKAMREPPATKTEPEIRYRRGRWFGWQTLLADLIVGPGIGIGVMAGTNTGAGYAVGGAFIGVNYFARAPILHFVNHGPARGAISLLVRVGCLFGGGLLGGGLGSIGGGLGALRGASIGAGIGVPIAIIVDAAALAYVQIPITPAPPPSPVMAPWPTGWIPTLVPRREGGATLIVAKTF